MHDVLRFWLDRGVDGFRIDVVHCIGKDPALPDDPRRARRHPPLARSTTTRAPSTCCAGIRAAARRLRRPDDGRRGRTSSATRVTERTAAYAGPDQLHLAFDFAPLRRPWGDAGARGGAASPASRRPSPTTEGRWPTWAFGNHDNAPAAHPVGRHARRVARAAAVLQLGLRGTPFLYAGDELGLLDADGARPTGSSTPAGATAAGRRCRGRRRRVTGGAAEPWLPFPPEAAEPVGRGPARPTSARSSGSTSGCSPPAGPRRPCARGDLRLLDAGDGVRGLGAARRGDGDRRVVLVSMADDAVAVEPG